MSETPLNCVIYDSSVLYFAIEKKDILNVHEYLLEKKELRIMLKFIKQAFMALLSLRELLATKFLPVNDEPCLVRPTLISLNSYGLNFFPFMINLDGCNNICNTLYNPCAKI